MGEASFRYLPQPVHRYLVGKGQIVVIYMYPVRFHPPLFFFFFFFFFVESVESSSNLHSNQFKCDVDLPLAMINDLNHAGCAFFSIAPSVLKEKK